MPIALTLFYTLSLSIFIPVKNDEQNKVIDRGRKIELAVYSGVNLARESIMSVEW